MKEFRLSTTKERIGSISFVAVMLVCLGVLLYALRSNVGLLIACGLGVLLIAVLLVMYVLNVLQAVCIVDPEKKTATVKGRPSYTVDISKAVMLQTMAKKIGQTTIRTLVFSDEEENVIAAIPTMFTFRQGMMAEPMAEEMAKVLGIEFKRNIPEWEFDKKKYEEHQKEVAAQERAEAKKRREARMAYRINKRKQQK